MVNAVDTSYELLDASPDSLGEGPVWSVLSRRFIWVDIRRHLIRSSDLDGRNAVDLTLPSEVGFAVPTEGGFVAGLRDGLFYIGDDGSQLLLSDAEWDTSRHRINDGKCDRLGRVWFGTMDDAEQVASAALYRFDGRVIHNVRGGIVTANGLGWSPDGRVMYHTDSATRTISRFAYDPGTGDISAPTEFVRDSDLQFPDGLTVDAAGCVWSAKWDGGRVVRYTPDGAIDRIITLPVSRPTSCAFVGNDFRTLAITSAQPPTGRTEPLAGRVFLLDVGVDGLPEVPANLEVGKENNGHRI